jgi:uncharacterized protein YggU (UPF0235/DUF167 family)
MSQEEKKPEVQAEQSPPPQEGDANADLTVFVEQLLGDMQQKFQNMSDQIIGRHILIKL